MVASTLLERSAQVRVVARDPVKVQALRERGAEVVQGDVLDPATLAPALEGAAGAYLLVPPDGSSSDLIGRGRRIVDGLVEALGAAAVPHAVVLSSVGAQHPEGTGPIVITNYAESELPKAGSTRFTFVRAAYFMENLLAYAGAMKGDGVLPVFGGGESYPFPMVATADIGRVAAEALLASAGEHTWIELSGPKEYSFADAAQIASATLGRTVTPMALPIDAMVPALTQVGLSENVAGLYRKMTESMGEGLIAFEGKGRAVRGTVTLEEVLRSALG